MIEALNREPIELEVAGETVEVRRPTLADLVALTDATQRGVHASAWYCWNHCYRDGRRMFASVEAVMELPLPWVLAVSREIDQLYGEGLDCRRAAVRSSRPPASS